MARCTARPLERPGRDREGLQLLSLGQAAKLTGTSKTTLTRAIRAGRLSATRCDGGSYLIDPAELSRVYTVTPATPETVAATGGVVHRATVERDPNAPPDMTARLAALDAEVRLLRELLDEVKANRDELRADRDGLRTDRDSLREQLLLLTDQRAAPADERPAWRRLFGWG